MWHDMFVAGVPLLERVIRAVLVYCFAIFALRLAGKRELGQLASFDLVVLLFFSNVLQNAIIGPDNSITGGIVGATTMLGLNRLVAELSYFHPRVDAIVDGQPTTLISGGVVQDANMRRELVSLSELMVACHKQGAYRVEDIDTAILEPDGSIAVFSRVPSRGELVDMTTQRMDELQASLARIEEQLRPRGGVPAAT
jgi:uncharacterized membrane protein YcaP (DUF421 family)